MDDVTLRPIHEADLDDLCRSTTDPDLYGEFDWTGFKDPRAMRRRWDEDGFLGAEHGRLAVVSSGSFVGDVSYKDQTLRAPKAPPTRSASPSSPNTGATA